MNNHTPARELTHSLGVVQGYLWAGMAYLREKLQEIAGRYARGSLPHLLMWPHTLPSFTYRVAPLRTRYERKEHGNSRIND